MKVTISVEKLLLTSRVNCTYYSDIRHKASTGICCSWWSL